MPHRGPTGEPAHSSSRSISGLPAEGGGMIFRSRHAALALTLVGIVAIAVGYLAFPAARWQAAQIASAPVQAVEQFFVPEPQKLFGKPEVRVLLVGLDYDYDDKDQETSKKSRSDIIMAINLDFRNRRIAELSVPRDMVATLPSGKSAKINQAQSEGGIAESQSVVAQWLGIPPFDRYVVLRIDTAKDLVNAIGGVDVVVKNSNALRGAGKNGPLDYDDSWGHLHITSNRDSNISTGRRRSATRASGTTGAAIRAASSDSSR